MAHEANSKRLARTLIRASFFVEIASPSGLPAAGAATRASVWKALQGAVGFKGWPADHGLETAQIAAKPSQRRFRAGKFGVPGTMIANKGQILSAAFLGAVATMTTEAIIDVQVKPQVEVHYAPAEDLEAIDVALISSARTKIDMAAYVLSSGRIRKALEHAQGRGVKLYLVLEEEEIEKDLLPPAETITVHRGAWTAIMHEKAYAIDGKLLRTGSANFSYSGLHKQNNDLVIIRDQKAVAAFEKQFHEMMK